MPIRNVQQKEGGCLKKLGCGCLVAIALLIGGGIATYLGAKTIVTKIAAYTEADPMELPAVDMPQADQNAVFQRIDAFTKATNGGQAGGELSLTAPEINALIQRSPAWAGRVYIRIEDDRILGDVSIPVGELVKIDAFKGRWLNGSAGLVVNTVSGRFMVFIDSLNVRGKTVPDVALSQIRSKNLAEELLKNPKSASVLQKLESVTVRDDRLVIKAK